VLLCSVFFSALTERNYVDILKAMKLCFREPLLRLIAAQDSDTKTSGKGAMKRMQSIVGKQPLKPSAELVGRIFLNLDPILSLHDTIMLPALEEKVKGRSSVVHVWLL
jgi:hypothetical protein